MIVLNSTPAAFRSLVKDKRIICFGSGDYFSLFAFDFGGVANVAGVIDNDKSKHGKNARAGNVSAAILSLEEGAKQFNSSNTILVITASAYREITAQLQTLHEFDSVNCYIYAQIKYSVINPANSLPHSSGTMQIPPVIHYCWFGGKPLPENLCRCIDSWRKLCLGYEIVEWNESNYDCNKNAWTSQALAQKRWSHLADYARIDIITAHGGIYLDTDIELLCSLDLLRFNKGFAATEAHGGVNLGSGFGAVSGLDAFRELLDNFDCEFKNSVSFCLNVRRETQVFWSGGYKLNGEFQVVKDVALLPFNVLTPIVNDTRARYFTDATMGVHYFNRGWQ